MHSGKGRRVAWLSVSGLLCLGAAGCWSTSSGLGARPNSPSPMWRPTPSGSVTTRPPGNTATAPSAGSSPASTPGTNCLPTAASPLPIRPESLSGAAKERATLNQGAIAANDQGRRASGEVLTPPEANSRDPLPIATSSNLSSAAPGKGVKPASHSTSGGSLPELDPPPGSASSEKAAELPPLAPISYQDIPIKRKWQKTSPPVMPVEQDLPPPNPNPKLRGAESAGPLLPPPQ